MGCGCVVTISASSASKLAVRGRTQPSYCAVSYVVSVDLVKQFISHILKHDLLSAIKACVVLFFQKQLLKVSVSAKFTV